MTSRTSLPDDPNRQLLAEILGTLHQIEQQLADLRPTAPPPAPPLPLELAQLPAQLSALSRQLASLLSRGVPRRPSTRFLGLIPLVAFLALLLTLLLRPTLWLPADLKRSLRLGQHLERSISKEQRDQLLRLLSEP